MNLCPPELHSYICQLACFDDGRTARSLRLVSKYYSEIATPFLYQCLSISGTDSIAHVLGAFEKTLPLMRRVRHLFVSEENPKYPRSRNGGPTNAERDRMIRLVAYAAPTLETLCFVTSPSYGNPALIARVFRLPFPILRELTVSGYYPFPSHPGNFPALERLHLSGNPNPHGLLQIGRLDIACPQLTHLRVSELSAALTFVLELQQAMKGDEHGVFPARLPKSIQNILVKLAAPFGFSKAPLTWQTFHKEPEMLVALEQLTLVGFGASKDSQFVLLPKSQQAADFREDWLDRLNGREGCWKC